MVILMMVSKLEIEPIAFLTDGSKLSGKLLVAICISEDVIGSVTPRNG